MSALSKSKDKALSGSEEPSAAACATGTAKRLRWKTYNNISEKENMADTPGESTMTLQVVLLIGPLGHDSERIFEESDDNQESTERRKVGLDGLGVLVDEILDLGCVFAHLVERRFGLRARARGSVGRGTVGRHG